MKMVAMNFIFFSFLGLMAYFVTPYALLILLLIQGYTEKVTETTTKKDK